MLHAQHKLILKRLFIQERFFTKINKQQYLRKDLSVSQITKQNFDRSENVKTKYIEKKNK